MRTIYTLLLISIVAVLLGCSVEPETRVVVAPGSSDSVTSVGHNEKPDLDHGAKKFQALPPLALHYGAREGQALFLHYCATCHGEQGQGDGFNAFNLDPSPRDLSDAAFQADRTDEELFELIHLGGAAAGFSNAMPPWGKTINDRGIHYLVSYLRELRVDPDETSADEE